MGFIVTDDEQTDDDSYEDEDEDEDDDDEDEDEDDEEDEEEKEEEKEEENENIQELLTEAKKAGATFDNSQVEDGPRRSRRTPKPTKTFQEEFWGEEERELLLQGDNLDNYLNYEDDDP